MVDRAIFLGMSGAKSSMQEIGIISNNLANANTIGFRADYEALQANPEQQDPKATRVSANPERTYSDFQPGPLSYTGRDLDIALQGPGFIAVQTKEGEEAYTRAGNLEVDPKGFLVTSQGDFVLGRGGLISIPQAQSLSIDNFGNIAIQLPGQGEKDLTILGQLKLVDIPTNTLQKGENGLFYVSGDEVVKASDTIRLSPKTLEGSNVNTVKSMVDLIQLSREFEMHVKLMKTMEENATRSNQLLDISK